MPVTTWDDVLPKFTRDLEDLIGKYGLHDELNVSDRSLAITVATYLNGLYFLKTGQRGFLPEQAVAEKEES